MLWEEKKFSLPKGKVAFNIVGEKRLQNELLASCLRNHTGHKCFIFKTINELPIRHKNQRILIVDCQNTNPEHMLMEMKNYQLKKQLNNHTVLVNVSMGMAFQKELIMNGVYGFFYEHDTVDNLLKGILSVINGKLWFSREMMSRCILEGTEKKQASKNITDKLTPRQVEILSMIAVGASNREISEKLFISPHTVKNHLYNIFKKIGVSNRIQASLWAAVHL